MIYDYPNETVPIRQGDIFYPLPWPYLDLGKLLVLDAKGNIEVTNWQAVKERPELVVNAPLNTTWGIIATQNCDVLRSPMISLFEIGLFKEITGLPLPGSTQKWMSLITQRSRLNARWFYLPPDKRIGFKERMAINFEVVLQIPRIDLQNYVKELRKGRLKEVPYEHYRESVGQYYRRYPYDEWYPLSKDEFAEYKKTKGEVKPFDWQI